MNKLAKILIPVFITILLLISIIVVVFHYKKNKDINLFSGEVKTELNSKSEKIAMQNMTSSYDAEVVSQETENNSLNNNVIEMEKNINPENIKIDIVEETISKNGVTIIVTDNNENSYAWDENYRIECKKDNEWIELAPKERVIVHSIAYNKDEHNQIKFEINWNYYYGELENGIYRIVKPIYNNEQYINIYSNEFEIN